MKKKKKKIWHKAAKKKKKKKNLWDKLFFASSQNGNGFKWTGRASEKQSTIY